MIIAMIDGEFGVIYNPEFPIDLCLFDTIGEQELPEAWPERTT
jgi:hypothetical protein